MRWFHDLNWSELPTLISPPTTASPTTCVVASAPVIGISAGPVTSAVCISLDVPHQDCRHWFLHWLQTLSGLILLGCYWLSNNWTDLCCSQWSLQCHQYVYPLCDTTGDAAHTIHYCSRSCDKTVPDVRKLKTTERNACKSALCLCNCNESFCPVNSCCESSERCLFEFLQWWLMSGLLRLLSIAGITLSLFGIGPIGLE